MSKVQLEILVMKREALKKEAEVTKKMSFVMSTLNSVILFKQNKPEPTKDLTVMRAMMDDKDGSHQDHEEGNSCAGRELPLQLQGSSGADGPPQGRRGQGGWVS